MKCEHNNAVKKCAVSLALFISLGIPCYFDIKRRSAEICSISTLKMTLLQNAAYGVIHGIPEITLETFAWLVFFIILCCLTSVIECLVETSMQRYEFRIFRMQLFCMGNLLNILLHVLRCWLNVGAADVFLETERKDFRMFSLEERERAVELYFTTPMTTAQVVEHLGYPTRQCLERWLAMDSRYAGHMAKPIIPLETRRRAVELVLGGMQQKQAAKQLGVSVGAVHGWVRAYRKGGMAALQPKNRNSAQGNKPADSRRRPSAADDDDAEALRRRVEELELENALMREVVEVVKKDPGADLRRLSNREKTLLIDRLRPAYSLSSMTCLLAIAPSSYHYHHARLGVDKYAGLRAEVAGAFADSKGRYGYRRIKAVLKTGVSEKVVRRIMAEEGLVAHVPKRRRYSSYEGETTPAPANLVDRDFTAERPNEKWLTDITEIKARDGKVYLSPMIDCFDGKIVAYTAGFSPNAELANRMLEKAASTLPGNARPLVHSDRGCHYRWPGWLGLMERFGLTRSMSAKGCSPDNAAAEGFFGRMKTEAVYPEKWEEHTRNEVLALVDEYIRWYNHERIKQSLGWMSPVQYRQSQGMAA